ncbi:MAG: hypothetical protein AVDCRST_MAG88-3424, partial [uncultured Thermomicrobiales bacterium]
DEGRGVWGDVHGAARFLPRWRDWSAVAGCVGRYRGQMRV